MALDAISLRKLPWENSWEWMQDYLAREEQLFAERVEEARERVGELAAAIEAFQRDTGEFPRALDELVERPRRLPEGSGDWPYLSDPDLDGIPLDPWGQRYRYLVPGTHNPGTFDVWSVHGNERDPRVWIGNWRE
jgi:general secretion pathway protein G